MEMCSHKTPIREDKMFKDYPNKHLLLETRQEKKYYSFTSIEIKRQHFKVVNKREWESLMGMVCCF